MSIENIIEENIIVLIGVACMLFWVYQKVKDIVKETESLERRLIKETETVTRRITDDEEKASALRTKISQRDVEMQGVYREMKEIKGNQKDQEKKQSQTDQRLADIESDVKVIRKIVENINYEKERS
jgi:septal ring factor EnvC (AmiA/AmiB activator)